jgi:Tfp pilus assembly protein PilX
MRHMTLTKADNERRGERGAALITMLLVSMLLLVAGGALVVSTSMTAQTSFDSTAEAQAYYGAEAGLQAALNVLRGNVAPSPLFGTNPSGSVNTLNKINFTGAVTLLTSNKVGDTSTTSRLSRWLSYDATFTDRVIVSPTSGYTTLNGIAYSVEVTDPDSTPSGEPDRLLVTATGYGPRGAQKKLQMIVKKAAFDIDPPATITVAGGSSMTFGLGSSNASGYSGNDLASPPEPTLPAIAVAAANVTTAQTAINGLNGTSGSTAPSTCPVGSQVYPCAADTLTTANTPGFLQSANAARAFLATAKVLAQSQGRYFSSKPASLGTSTTPMFTFIDNYGGDTVTLGPGYQGNGLLIVTGDLDTNGNTDFDGIILVLGGGVMTRSGGGNGVIAGSIIVAAFDPSPTATTGFNAPTFDVSGGGNSDIAFDSVKINNALKSAGRIVVGVVEKFN